MILNNYYAYKGTIDKTEISGNPFPSSTGAYDTSGEALEAWLGLAQNGALNMALRLNLGVIVGTGNVEVQATDYCLSNDITASLSSFNATINSGADGGANRTTIVITGLNNTGASVTLTEIGVYKTVLQSNSGTQSKNVLFIRHMLNEPKIVANGEGFSLTFEWVES